jgi:hypothetical protein
MLKIENIHFSQIGNIFFKKSTKHVYKIQADDKKAACLESLTV